MSEAQATDLIGQVTEAGIRCWVRGGWDSAFVEHHPDGRELDVHGVHVIGETVRLFTKNPWALPYGILLGVGG